MKIINTPPKGIYERAQRQFGVSFDDGIVFTVGDDLHIKNEKKLTRDLIEHEKTHSRQQNIYGVDEWWDKYFEDSKFRFDQELEAYRNQYKYIKRTEKDRNIIARYLYFYASCLSGKMYGSISTLQGAKELIKK